MSHNFKSCHDGFNIRDRVVTENGEVGILESIDPDRTYCDVRLLTEDNKPSNLTTPTPYATLKNGVGVVPFPRQGDWHGKAQDFKGFKSEVVRDLL